MSQAAASTSLHLTPERAPLYKPAMAILSPRLRRLDAALADLPAESEAMLLSELDGYLAGVIVCPELILPGEWLPAVWGSDDGGSPFADEHEARWYVELIMAHYNAVIRTLAKGGRRYEPFLEVDARHDEVLWELWIEGFGMAMKLRPDSWAAVVASGDEDVAEALAGMTMLIEVARDESDLERGAIEALTEEAPALIPVWVELLNAWRLTHYAPPLAADGPRPTKAGRNDPCPCGSGKKYKRCCGLN